MSYHVSTFYSQSTVLYICRTFYPNGVTKVECLQTWLNKWAYILSHICHPYANVICVSRFFSILLFFIHKIQSDIKKKNICPIVVWFGLVYCRTSFILSYIPQWSCFFELAWQPPSLHPCHRLSWVFVYERGKSRHSRRPIRFHGTLVTSVCSCHSCTVLVIAARVCRSHWNATQYSGMLKLELTQNAIRFKDLTAEYQYIPISFSLFLLNL